MRTFLLTLAVVFAIIALSFAGLGIARYTQPFAAETNRLTESNSRNRVDGVREIPTQAPTKPRVIDWSDLLPCV